MKLEYATKRIGKEKKEELVKKAKKKVKSKK
jgi:hypothetical protein